MTSEPTKDARRDHAAGETSGEDPLSAGPHVPGAEDNGQAATTSAAARNRVLDQEEIPPQHNPNALAKAALRKHEAH